MCGRYLFVSPLETIQQMFRLNQMGSLAGGGKILVRQARRDQTLQIPLRLR